jgi:hypothetical protein
VRALQGGRAFLGAARLSRLSLIVPLAVAACTASAPERNANVPRWLVDSVPSGDLVHATDDEAALAGRLGAANVARDTLWLAEGAHTLGTVLFPADPRRRVEVAWSDTVRRARPEFVRVNTDSSQWRVVPGVGMGTTLAELERLNGRPFKLLGFHWDYEGTVSSWEGGRLDSLWSGAVMLRLRPPPNPPADLTRQVLGDRELTSSHPAMQRLAPRVYEIRVLPR